MVTELWKKGTNSCKAIILPILQRGCLQGQEYHLIFQISHLYGKYAGIYFTCFVYQKFDLSLSVLSLISEM